MRTVILPPAFGHANRIVIPVAHMPKPVTEAEKRVLAVAMCAEIGTRATGKPKRMARIVRTSTTSVGASA